MSSRKRQIGEFNMLDTSHQMNIDRVLVPEAVQVKSSLFPEDVVDVVCSPAVRPSDGARRERGECEIPKSVAALPQSANALILTTDLFHLAAPACPTPNIALKTRVLREP